MKGNTSKKLHHHVNKIMQHKGNNEIVIEILGTLQQKLQVYSYRLRKYTESNSRKIQDKLFKNNEKSFYKYINKEENIEIKITPTTQEIANFWQSIWSVPVQDNYNSNWIHEEEKRYTNIEQNEFIVTSLDITKIIKKTHNWKCPGVDQILMSKKDAKEEAKDVKNN